MASFEPLRSPASIWHCGIFSARSRICPAQSCGAVLCAIMCELTAISVAVRWKTFMRRPPRTLIASRTSPEKRLRMALPRLSQWPFLQRCHWKDSSQFERPRKLLRRCEKPSANRSTSWLTVMHVHLRRWDCSSRRLWNLTVSTSLKNRAGRKVLMGWLRLLRP